MLNFEEIDITKIFLGEDNIRKIDVDLGIEELAKSIHEQGLLQPIIVRKTSKGFELVAGQRRLAAITKLGWQNVPAMIVDTSNPTTLMLISLIENVQRVDIDERDRAKAIEKLVDANNGDYAVVARMLGMTEQTIRKWSGYHGVPEDLKRMKERGELRIEETVRLTNMLGPDKAVEVAKEITHFPPDQRKKVLSKIKRYSLLEPEEALLLATKPPKEKPLTVRFMTSIMTALEKAAAARGETPTETVEYIVREWLQKRNYITESSP